VQKNDLRAAQAECLRLNAEHPDFAAGWRTASHIVLRMGDAAGSLTLVERALALAPADGRALLHRAHCLHALHRRADALAEADSMRSIVYDDAHLLDALGTFYSLLGEHTRAQAAYDRALELAPGDGRILFNRAAVRRFVGRLTEAEDDLDRAIAARPADYEAYKLRSDLRAQTGTRNHTEELERLLAAGIPDWPGEVQVRYALAKEYEDLSEYVLSWFHLAQGAQCRRRHMQYDVATDVDTVQWIKEAFPAAPPQTIAECSSSQPIFIVGLPRSGSTLVERILGSHSEVCAAGELIHLAQAIVQAVRNEAGPAPLGRAQLVARSANIDFASLGRDYLRRVPPPVRELRFIDKMPLNYLYCGLIQRALPNARILHVSRGPMAACYAIFKTLFKDGYPFSYDLEELGRYYVGYRRLMDHWMATAADAIHEVSYERLVGDLRGETGRLLDFCDLAWEDSCLDFHRNPSPTTTASAAQVRQPLYDSSLHQWRHYERQLEGLRRQLIAAGIRNVESA
jgi:hypothetical protein